MTPFSLHKMLSTLVVLALSQVSKAHSEYNGMDMSMDGGMQMTMGNMLMYLHFTPGDNILFLGWAPATPQAQFGTCIGLFLLALVDRWLSTMKAVMVVHWRAQALMVLANRTNSSKAKEGSTPSLSRTSIPFVFAYDFPRALITAALALLEFTFMLIIMTYQVSFIVSIVIGMGVGEALFGRYVNGGSRSHLH